ncbi:MAG: hypothetical protein ACLFQ2_12510 [Wenzhouxiangella sp.]
MRPNNLFSLVLSPVMAALMAGKVPRLGQWGLETSPFCCPGHVGDDGLVAASEGRIEQAERVAEARIGSW